MKNILEIKKFTSDIIDNMSLDKYKNQYLDWLLTNKDSYINDNSLKISIIKNQNTPISILLEFYKNYNYNFDILKDVLKIKLHKIKDLVLLKELLIDKDDLIISSIIRNNNIDNEIIEVILKYNNKKWVEELINYNRLSLDKMIAINEKSSYGLKDNAYKYLEKYVLEIRSPIKLEKLMHYTSKDLNYFISQSKYLTTELFALLSHSNDFKTRAVLAERIDTPIEVLYTFMEDESDSVKLGLAKNINSDSLILAELAKNNKVTILKEVIINPNTTKIILKSVINSESITNDLKIIAKSQLDNLNNLNVESNLEYYSILENLKFGKFDRIDIFGDFLEMDTERRKVFVKLSDDF